MQNMKDYIYLDNAATTPLDSEVWEKMSPYFTQTYGNADSPHVAGRRAMAAIDCARDKVADCLNAKPSEIYFTSGGTEADNWAILGAARAMRKQGRNHVLVSSIEHHAVLFAAETLKEEGFAVDYIPVNEGGRVELNAVKKLIKENTALICVMRVNNETGVIQPVEQLAALAHERGALFFTDCVQAAPHEKIDVKKWGVDLLSVSSHKLHGPKGCGVLYVRSGVKIEKLVGGGEQERGMRGGTLNVPAIVGFAAAFEKTEALREETEKKMVRLQAVFLEQLKDEESIFVGGDPGHKIPAVLSLRVVGIDNATLLYKSDLQGVCIAAGSACASASVKPSHVLMAMGRTEKEARETVRISFENLSIILAGLLFGPLIGGVVGAVADLVGCVLVGYAINPIITAGAVLIGVISGVVGLCITARGAEKLGTWRIFVPVCAAHIVGSMAVKTIGMMVYYGTPAEIFYVRVPLYFAIALAEGYLMLLLFRSKTFTGELHRIIHKKKKVSK